MPETYRWTLAEYVMRVEDATNLKEVVAEGLLDRGVISDAIDRWGIPEVGVIDASDVWVSDEELDRIGLGTGVKRQLLAISLGVDEAAAITPISATVIVVVDRDYDPPLPPSLSLLETDGHSMESYAMDSSTLGRFIRVGESQSAQPMDLRDGSAGNSGTARALLNKALLAAAELAAVRLTLRELEPPLAPFAGWPSYLGMDAGGVLHLDGTLLLSRVLVQHGRSGDVSGCEARRQAVVSTVLNDAFSLVRGHDFISVLHRVLKSVFGGGFVRRWPEDALCRALFLGMAPEALDRQPMFEHLRGRLMRG
jgi:hypothetical protein